jgi:hypothetical protein
MSAGNAFLMDFLSRSAVSNTKMVLGPSKTSGEDMETAPKSKKEPPKKPKVANPIHQQIQDEKWNRAKIMDYLRSLSES